MFVTNPALRSATTLDTIDIRYIYLLLIIQIFCSEEAEGSLQRNPVYSSEWLHNWNSQNERLKDQCDTNSSKAILQEKRCWTHVIVY